MTAEEKILRCRECGRDFLFTPEEQDFYTKHGYGSPRRCKDCRRAARLEKAGLGPDRRRAPHREEEARRPSGQGLKKPGKLPLIHGELLRLLSKVPPRDRSNKTS